MPAIPPPRTPAEREDLLHNAVRGLELDADEELALAQLARRDPWTVAALAKLFERVRGAGMVKAIETEDALRRHRATQVARTPGQWVPGNTGSGF